MSNLPSNYTRVEYIIFSGTQYINTQVLPSQNSAIEIKVSTQQTSMGGLCVSGKTWVDSSFGLFVNNAVYGDNYLGTKFYGAVPTVVKIDHNLVYQDGSLIGSFQEAIFRVQYPLYLMARNFANSGAAEFTSGNLYYCKIYENDNLIRDFVPCINPSNEVGLYDIINNKFYGNDGTGILQSGPILQKPNSPTGLSNKLSVTIVWESVDCDGYNVYKNGEKIAQIEQTYYTDINVFDGESITYSVSSYGSGGESDPVSISVNVKEGYTILIPIVNSAFFQ